MSIIYDRAKLSDLADIMAIEQEDFAEMATDVESMREHLLKSQGNFLVARLDGRTIAYIEGPVSDERYIADSFFHGSPDFSEAASYQTITSLAVHPDYQGQGIAQELLKRLIEVARSQGRKGVSLTCLEHLIGYYEKFGFSNEGKSESEHAGKTWYNMMLNL